MNNSFPPLYPQDINFSSQTEKNFQTLGDFQNNAFAEKDLQNSQKSATAQNGLFDNLAKTLENNPIASLLANGQKNFANLFQNGNNLSNLFQNGQNEFLAQMLSNLTKKEPAKQENLQDITVVEY